MLTATGGLGQRKRRVQRVHRVPGYAQESRCSPGRRIGTGKPACRRWTFGHRLSGCAAVRVHGARDVHGNVVHATAETMRVAAVLTSAQSLSARGPQQLCVRRLASAGFRIGTVRFAPTPQATGRQGEKGLLSTTSGFTADAKGEANRDGAPPVDPVDGASLRDLLEQTALGSESSPAQCSMSRWITTRSGPSKGLCGRKRLAGCDGCGSFTTACRWANPRGDRVGGIGPGQHAAIGGRVGRSDARTRLRAEALVGVRRGVGLSSGGVAHGSTDRAGRCGPLH